MKYCTKCGKEINEEAVICIHCGCPVATGPHSNVNYYTTASNDPLLLQLSQRVHTNAVIWIVIGALQCLSGIGIIAGVWNIYSAITDIKYSKDCLVDPFGIVDRFEPLSGPIITLALNLVLGGIVGVVGSIYYFIAIRGFVLDNRIHFNSLSDTVAK